MYLKWFSFFICAMYHKDKIWWIGQHYNGRCNKIQNKQHNQSATMHNFALAKNNIKNENFLHRINTRREKTSKTQRSKANIVNEKKDFTQQIVTNGGIYKTVLIWSALRSDVAICLTKTFPPELCPSLLSSIKSWSFWGRLFSTISCFGRGWCSYTAWQWGKPTTHQKLSC